MKRSILLLVAGLAASPAPAAEQPLPAECGWPVPHLRECCEQSFRTYPHQSIPERTESIRKCVAEGGKLK